MTGLKNIDQQSNNLFELKARIPCHTTHSLEQAILKTDMNRYSSIVGSKHTVRTGVNRVLVLPTLQGALKFFLGEAVVVCDKVRTCKFLLQLNPTSKTTLIRYYSPPPPTPKPFFFLIPFPSHFLQVSTTVEPKLKDHCDEIPPSLRPVFALIPFPSHFHTSL